MKKSFLLIVMLFGISALCFSQHLVDVLYLKDGSIIRGQIIEQIPAKTVKIETYDGSIFVYNVDQVEKIVKERSRIRRSRNREVIHISSNNGYYYSLRGYKGFVDVGYNFGDYEFLEINTSHGFQFNNHFFIGGGMGVHHYTDYDITTVPVFANFRANFINNKVTPFADIKLGYAVGDIEGPYLSLAVGVRFALKNKTALNLMVGYTRQGEEYYYNGYHYHDYEYDYADSFGLKFGFEF